MLKTQHRITGYRIKWRETTRVYTTQRHVRHQLYSLCICIGLWRSGRATVCFFFVVYLMMHAREQRRLSLDQIARILRFLVYFREEASPHDEHKKDKRITFQLLRMRKYSNGIARDVCIHTTLFISNDGNVFIDGGADPTRVTNRRLEFDEEDATALFHSSFLLRSANKNSKCFVSLNRFRPLFFFFFFLAFRWNYLCCFLGLRWSFSLKENWAVMTGICLDIGTRKKLLDVSCVGAV